MSVYLVLVLVILVVNLLPAFGPPTWAVLVWFAVSFHLEVVLMVCLGALAAATGRLLLALAARHTRGRLSDRRLAGLRAATAELGGSRGRTAAALGLFFLSPLPSGQLFVAAGLLSLRLRPIILAFLAGRLVSYSIYVAIGVAARASLTGVIGDAVRSPLGLALNVVMLAGLYLMLRVDWSARLGRRGSAAPPSASGSTGDALRR